MDETRREQEWQRHARSIGEYRLEKAEEDGGYCPGCVGRGFKLYGSTSTWRGGIGGQAMTSDVCDDCWGSGCAGITWPDRRLHERKARR